MNKIIRFINKLFKKYKTGYEYWIDIEDIKIPKHFKNVK